MGLLIDTLYEILVRASVKTIGIFRCVAKQCRTLVSSTSFIEDHIRRRSHGNPLLLLTRCEYDDLNQICNLHLSTISKQGNTTKEFSIEGLQQGMYAPVQSCLGLVCIGVLFERSPILVCNPTTEELVVLPPHQGNLHLSIGFGYAASTKEFKVVRFFSHPEHPETKSCCEVFTFGSSGWREARNPPPYCFFYPNAPFLHGALHMLPIKRGVCPDILAFDIETEEYSTIPLPERCYTPKYCSYVDFHIEDLGGSLCLILESGLQFNIEIWCLKDYDNREWAKLCSIDLESFGFTSQKVSVQAKVLVDDETLMLEVITDDQRDPLKGALYYYNFVSKNLTKDTKQNNSALTYLESTYPLGVCSHGEV